MGADTIKVLSEASLSFTLVIGMITMGILYFRSQKQMGDNQARQDETSKLLATSNLVLSKSLDAFAQSAADSVLSIEKTREAVQTNLVQLRVESAKLDAIENREGEHALNARTRDAASITRDEATMKAITELPSKMRLVIEEETNELQLQILVAFRDFMSQLTTPEKQAVKETVDEAAAESAPELGESTQSVKVEEQKES